MAIARSPRSTRTRSTWRSSGPRRRRRRGTPTAHGNFEGALQKYGQAIEEGRETAGYHLERARILGMRNEVESAVAEFQMALGELRQKDEKSLVVLYDSKALAEYSIATLLEGAGNAQKARDAYGRALQEDLAYYPAHMRLGLLALSQGDTTAAMSELALASDIATDDPYVHYMNGWVLGKAKHTTEAVAELTKATTLEPYYALPNLVLGTHVRGTREGARSDRCVRALSRAGQCARSAARLRHRARRGPEGVREGADHPMMRRAFRAALVLMALSVAAPIRAAGQSDGGGPIRRRTTYEDLQLFGQVLNQIRVNHPDSIEAHELFLAAVEAMVHAADPHSYVIPAMRLDAAKAEALEKGKLYPLPVDFSFVGGTPVVVSVAAGTAARRLDILPGDELVAVDGGSFMAHSAAELDVELAGPKKTPVTPDARAAARRRHLRAARSRRAARAGGGGDGRARGDDARLGHRLRARDDLRRGARRRRSPRRARTAGERGMQQLLLDLRDNGGGSVAEAAHVAGEFLPRGAIVYTSEGRKPEITDTGRVKRSFFQLERRYPIVVMVNAGTASASELVAGALQDHDRALIVGRPTFGKSLLMRGFPMSDGSVLVLVVGHVRTPCGRVVQRQYRSITRREYYRLARAERDTAGRPSCQTDAGRTVYGGGGIFPDLALPECASQPRWASRLAEQQLLMTWSGGYVDAHGATLTDVDAFSARELPAAALADFRAYAVKQGVSVPPDGTLRLACRVRRKSASAAAGSSRALNAST